MDLETLVADLKTDVRDAVTRIENSISSMRQEFREDFVRREAFEALKEEVAEIKESRRWTIGTVVIPTLALLASVAAVVVALILH